MKNIHINDSYKIWSTSKMLSAIICEMRDPHIVLNRTYISMYIEWWLHNIGYYITKPFCFIEAVRKINLRCKDVDLEEWKLEE